MIVIGWTYLDYREGDVRRMSKEIESVEKFREAVKISRNLIDNGSIFIFVSSIEYSEIKVQVDRESLESILKPTAFSYDEFNSHLGEISRLLSVCLDNKQDSFMKSRVVEWRDEEQYDETRIADAKSVLESKLQSVIETIIDDSLRQRYFLKKYAKSPYFTGFEWEVNVKHSDGETDVVKPLPYATCQIRFIQPGTKYRFPFMEHTESVQIDWTEEEIDYITRVFEVIKQRIRYLKGISK